MRLLSVIDLLFLTLERRNQPMHVGGLFLFRLPGENPEAYLQNLVAQLRDGRFQPVAPFNQMVKNLSWDADQQFDIDQHIRHVSLPKPGRIRELLAYVSHEHSALLDKAKPLWECHVIEGIEDNRFAIYLKVHHALMDGIGAMRLVEKSLSRSADVQLASPIWSMRHTRPAGHARKPALFGKVLSRIRDQAEALATVRREVKYALHEMKYNPDYVSAWQAPQSILNLPVSSSRRFAAQSYSLSRIHDVAHRLEVTINDVVLAMCAGALRAYLQSQNALPARPLVAMVPVSIRREGDAEAGGNQFSMVLANLGTHLADPLERLDSVRRSMQNGKSRFRRMSQSAIIEYSGLVYSLAGINLVTGLFPRHQAFNLVISNVPGPREPLYLNGARMEGLYPASIVLDGQAVNITMTSYDNRLDAGIIACRRSMPHMQNLLGLLEDELTLLEQLSLRHSAVGPAADHSSSVPAVAGPFAAGESSVP